MAVFTEFRDDDAGYLRWLVDHRDGYVINISRAHTPSLARLHHAGCPTINGVNPHAGAWTGPYVKVCAQRLSDLQGWAIEKLSQPVSLCGRCRPDTTSGQRGKPATIEHTDRSWRPQPERHGPMTEGQAVVHGPDTGRPVVEAWADDYIRFDHRPPWQEALRGDIRRRCQLLTPSSDEILHATFSGAKLPNADVENLLIYNIDTFKTAGANGIRFEHDPATPASTTGQTFPFAYRYEISPRSNTFNHWQPGRVLTSFDWTRLDNSAEATKLAHVWLALAAARNPIRDDASVCTIRRSFAVRVQVRPPRGRRPVWGGLLKGIFDGVICAFHSHTDIAVLPEVATRLATALHAEPRQIANYLTERSSAVLGPVARLVSPYRDGVKWDPADHWCVAGELLAAGAEGPNWSIKGEVVEVMPVSAEADDATHG